MMCKYCHRVPAVDGRVMCPRCLVKNRARTAAYRATEHKPAPRECPTCGHHGPTYRFGGSRRCDHCINLPYGPTSAPTPTCALCEL